jgi:hypothetical protein
MVLTGRLTILPSCLRKTMNEAVLKLPAKSGNTNKVAIVFSSANASSFTYYKTFAKHSNITCIFIRDPYLVHWYQSGVGGVINSWADLINYIKTEVSNVDYSLISFWGSSMGGYAALKAASEFYGSSCYSFSPQTILNNKLPHNVKDVNLFGRDSSINLNNSSFREFGAAIIFGAADLVDLYNIHLANVSSKWMYPIYEGDHLVSALLHKSGFFSACIDHWIKYGNAQVSELLAQYEVVLDTRAFSTDYMEYVYDVVNAYYIDRDYFRCLDLLDKLLARGENSGMYMLKGHIHAHQGNLIDAESCFSNALMLAASALEPAKQFGAILLKVGNFDSAIKYFKIALTARTNDYDSLCGISTCYGYIGNIESAKINLLKAYSIRPSSKRAFQISDKFGISLL